MERELGCLPVKVKLLLVWRLHHQGKWCTTPITLATELAEFQLLEEERIP
jgi:hypothetical protein